ncbi:16S rRNA (uracil(1498)-N(3))-methyltransferase [Halonatronum saccharophilum]|uniref:16S rRNA (uracil(1498)-N(3))-methyltransferase n=1 Tax=Halonatronum saccharophilum TaxID=150060 RepID=UPI0004869117|nr:16S rRNA (uracil(1498)-N(3))-methyltransferase [Halonatronum saccharophilum]
MNHFFVKPQNIDEGVRVLIEGDDVSHITLSLRLKEGDQITVADGEGNKYLVELTFLDEKEVRGDIIKEFDRRIEPEVKVALIQGLPKSKKMDIIAQKCTELGIKDIIPFDSERTIVRLNKKKVLKRQKRWQKICKEAAKQSGRARIPKIHKIADIDQILERAKDYDLVLVPWEDEEVKGLKETLVENKEVKKIMIVVGPEGGLSSKEVEAFKEIGGRSVTLGPRILRTETAGLATLSMVLYELGELG